MQRLSPEKLLNSWGSISEMLKLIFIRIYCWLLAPRPQLGFPTHYCISSFSGCDPFICQFPRLIPGSLLLFWALRFRTLRYDLALWILTISVSILCTWSQALMIRTKPWKLFLVGLILKKPGQLFKWSTCRPSGLKRSLLLLLLSRVSRVRLCATP